MRIRKRTPARAADPGPEPALSASPPRPLPLQLQHDLKPKERSREDNEEEAAEEEKRVILVAGVRVQGPEPEDDRVPAAAAASNDRCVPTQPLRSPLFRCPLRDLLVWVGVAEKSLFFPPVCHPRSSAMDDGGVPKPEPEPEPREGAAARCTRNDGKRWRCKGAAVPGYLFCDRHIAWSTRKRKPRPRKHKQQGNGGVLDPIAKDEDAASAAEDAPEPGHGDGGFQKRAKGGGAATGAAGMI
ncbi:unnamed protein product [Urochloa decumbens]|uniref:WRC domain-containing protein n=1 Tax=Urochloa decumbens TaxID=240449 RepID=A0ABC8XVS9_9POAL